MASKKNQRKPGRAASRALASLPQRGSKGIPARSTVVATAAKLAESRDPRVMPTVGIMAEEVLAAAGISSARIPVLAARLRSGTGSKIDFAKELAR